MLFAFLGFYVRPRPGYRFSGFFVVVLLVLLLLLSSLLYVCSPIPIKLCEPEARHCNIARFSTTVAGPLQRLRVLLERVETTGVLWIEMEVSLTFQVKIALLWSGH